MTIGFTASGFATHPNCERVLDHICGRLGDHVTVTKSTTGAQLETAIGSINMAISSGRIFVDIRCPTAAMLFTIRSMMAEQLYSAADEEPLELHWADGPQASRIPDFREVAVVGARMITPHMRRVTVATHDAQHFSDGGLHVRLLIPPTGREPVWPHTEPDGRIHWPKGEDALTIRAYTIRNIDLVRGHLEIDFVIHEGDNVPGASWALNARAGDRVGLMGPGGGGAPDAQDIFLAGDETALPAIARIMAAAPSTANLRILVEVEDQAEEQELACRAKYAVTWVHRNGRPAGTTGSLRTPSDRSSVAPMRPAMSGPPANNRKRAPSAISCATKAAMTATASALPPIGNVTQAKNASAEKAPAGNPSSLFNFCLCCYSSVTEKDRGSDR